MSRRAGIVLVALLVAAACSSGDDDDDGGGAGVSSLAAGLASLPAPSGDEPATVAFGDLAQAADLAGVDFAAVDVDAGDPETMATLNAVLGQATEPGSPRIAALPPEAAHTERLIDVGEFVDEVGWHVFQVDRFVEYQVPPNNVTVMEGRFDEDRLTEALGEPDDGVWVIGDPDGDVDLRDLSVARPLGEPLWLSLIDGDRLVVTRTPEGMDAVRGDDGDRGTLGDDENLMALADVLDAEDVYSALFHNAPLTVDMSRVTPEQAEALCEESLPEAFSALAAGIADDGDPLVVLAFANADDDAAQANADALRSLVEEGKSLQTRELWSDTFEVDSIDTDGAVTVARLRLTPDANPGIWRQLFLVRDNLVTTCA